MTLKISSLLPFIGEYAVASVLCDKKEKYGMINRCGDFVIPPLWDMISYAGGDLVALSVGFYRGDDCYDEDDGIWSLCSVSGRSVTLTKYSDIHLYSDSLHFSASDLESERYGIVSICGEVLVPFEYDYIGRPNKNGLIRATKNGKSGYIDINGNVKIPLIYDNLSPIFETSLDDWLVAEKDGECYYIDQTNKRVLL